MLSPFLTNSLIFLCITAGVAAAVYAMLLARDAYTKYEEGSEMRKKTMKKVYLFILVAIVCTAGRLLVSYYLNKG